MLGATHAAPGVFKLIVGRSDASEKALHDGFSCAIVCADVLMRANDVTIFVGNKWDKGAIYIGRGSPLGNIFVMKDESERDFVCDAYEVWFNEKVKQNHPVVMQVRFVRTKRTLQDHEPFGIALQELRRLYKLAKQGDVVLGCYCSPKRCHGDTIKKFLDSYI